MKLLVSALIVWGFSLGMGYTQPVERFVGDEWTFVPFSMEFQPNHAQLQPNVQYSIDSYDVQPAVNVMSLQ